MKTTVFTKYHIANGAKMAEFAGYNMPIEFSGINDEHHTVRNGAGVFDVSHMGSYGEVPKRLKGHPWKGCRSLIAARGFKSLLLRLAVAAI